MAFALFNPCEPCCYKSAPGVLIYGCLDGAGQLYGSLLDVYVKARYPVNYIGRETGCTPDVGPLDGYRLIIIPMLTFPVPPDLQAPAMLRWLGRGGRRLVVTGEYGDPTGGNAGWETTIAATNSYMDAVGVPLGCEPHTLVANQGGGFPACSHQSVFQPHYLTLGLSGPFYEDASSVVTGGVGLVKDANGNLTGCIYRLPGVRSEVVLFGDSNGLGGVCSQNPGRNASFLLNLHPLQVPVQ